MSFQSRLFLQLLSIVLVLFAAIAYGVIVYVSAVLNESDTHQTESQDKQVEQQLSRFANETARRVENVANAETMTRMAIDLAHSNVSQSLYSYDAIDAARNQNLDLLEITSWDGTVISSVQDRSRVGRKTNSKSAKGELAASQAAVGFDGKIIAAVVLQHYATASFSESGNRAADGEGSSRACNLDVADVRCGRAAAIGYGASLRGTGWLDIHGDEIRAANGDRRLKSEGAAGGNRKVIGAIVLQNKPGAKQTDDVATDGSSPGGTCDLDASNVGSGCAAAVGYRAGLGRSGRRRRN